MKASSFPLVWLIAGIWFGAISGFGASSTWINPNGGSWTNASNWSSGIIADGSGSTANFTTLNLSSDTSVSLDSARTLTSLSFDDQNLTKHGWFLTAGTGGTLTFAGASPGVTVLSATTTIAVPLAGTAGLAKNGAGKLLLTGANTYNGVTLVNVGTLGLNNALLAAGNPVNIAGASAVLESLGTLNLGVNTSSTAIDLYGLGTLRLASVTNSATWPDFYFGPNHSGNSCWGARISCSIDLGTTQRYVFGNSGHNGVGPYGLTGTDCQFAGPISGSAGLTIIGQNNWTGADAMEVPFAFNAANSFTGPIEIQRGSVYLGNANALTQGNTLSLNAAAGNNARFFLYGNNASISDLSSPGTGSAQIANGNRKTGAAVTLGPVTLTVTENHDTSFGGSISDVFAEYTGSGSGTTGPLNLLKNGPAILRLTGVSAYSGTTTIGSGTLQVDGAVSAGAFTAQTGSVLSGLGTLNGPVTIQSGATLAPGGGSIGTLTINGNLNLSGRALFKISKVGTSLFGDQITGLGTLNASGSLVVTNIGDPRTGALSPGDFFSLLPEATFQGTFTNLSLPPLSAGLTWDTSNLFLNGAIAVVGSNSPPIIVSPPKDLTVTQGFPASLAVVAAGARPFAYQWLREGSVISSGTNSTLSIPAASTNDSGAYRVVITNIFGSTTSAVANLLVLPAGVATSITNGLLVYLNFDNSLAASANTTNSGFIYLGGGTSGPRYKAGVIGAAASFANTATAGQPDDWAVTLGNLEWIYWNSFSVSLWERSFTSGDGALIGNKDWSSGANVGWVISTLDPKNVNWNATGGTRRDIPLNPPFSDGNWHLITVTFDRSLNQVTCYVDGNAANTSDVSPSGTASFNAGYSTLVGSSGNGPYAGAGDLDDLGIWNRVLTPQEVAGIYGAGLGHKPLPLAVPGVAPLIAVQPGDINTTAGLNATFSVTATGPGPLQYQWRFNGTNIAGATDSTLVLTSISAANQGVYTVLISNGSGAVVSVGAVLTVYTLAITGQWDFDRADLRATAGADMEYWGDASNLTSFATFNINGLAAQVMAVGSNSPSQGFLIRHGAKPNGGGHFVNQYTLIMDLMFPSGSTAVWRALFQTDPFNHDGNDAEFYVGDSSSSPDPGGIGAETQYNGTLSPGNWYRVVFAVDLAAPAGQQLCKYINGIKVGSQSLSGGLDGRFALGPTALLFTSGLTGGGRTAPGFVNSVQFMNGWLPPEAVATLGGPAAAGLPAGNAALQIVGISQNASQLTLSWSGPDGQFQLQKNSDLSGANWQDYSSLTSNHSVTLPITEPTAFYRVSQFQPDLQVGQLPHGEQSLPSKQILRTAGQQLQFSGRPVDLVLSPDGSTLYIKNLANLLVVDAQSWRVLQTLNYPNSGASLHGIAVSPDGSHVYVTGSNNELYDWAVATNRSVSFARTLSLLSTSFPCGVAISPDGAKAYVCLSMNNTLAVVDLTSGALTRQIPVGVAPWDVTLAVDGSTAFVSDWGGRLPISGDLTATSAGTPVVIDDRGVGSSGAVSFVNLLTGIEAFQVPTGLHPSDLELSPDGHSLYVANANSDTVTVLDTQTHAAKETILVRPDPTFPYGSASDGLALSKDGRLLFVASAGNNAVAQIELSNAQHTNSLVQGFLPTDWYPGAVAVDSNSLYVVNVKGLGSRLGQPANTTWQIGAFLGTANKIPLPSAESLSKFTAQAFEDGRVSQIKDTQQPPLVGQAPVPVPRHVGEPSVFQHVLYILKENKTYDQMFGDITQGNGNSSLCIYPQFVSPNHHALAQQYVLLDNFYCSGVNSADGHSWSTEGNDTDHLEKAFGGFTRSYTFGDDALTYSSTGFIWNNALQHGLTFRNYGEMDYASTSPSASWLQIYADYTNHSDSIRYVQNIGVASLRPYSSTNVPGWNVGIPDVVRARGFIKELNAAQSSGVWAAFHLLYLPNDHTGGPPTPRAQVADNDLALGQVVEAVTHSVFATNTVIFVIEDDPQSGYDHVDAHRSICLVISPYTRRNQVVSTFYNQAGVLHTMEQILGIPPMNQQDAMAPLMFDCFTNVPNSAPYSALANNVALTEGVTGIANLSSRERYWARKLQKMDFSKPDRINEDTFNRYIWWTVKGDAPYPAKYVGGHGKGLKQLGLVLDKTQRDDD